MSGSSPRAASGPADVPTVAEPAPSGVPATARPAPDDGVPGTLVVVVGASGSGKDSLLAAAREAFAGDPAVHFVERTVTRPPGDAHEPHASVTEAEFEALAARGAFAVEWGAHGLRYGVPRSAHDALAAGSLVVLNGSREALGRIAAAFPGRREIVHVTVSRDRLETRLRARGRESEAAIERRLARKVDPVVADDPVWRLDNNGTLADASRRFVARLGALVPGRAVPAPETSRPGRTG